MVLDVRGLPIVRQWFVVKRREKRLLPAALLGFAWLVAGALAPSTTTTALPVIFAVLEA